MDNCSIKNNLIELVKLENHRPIPPIILINKYKEKYKFHDKKLLYKIIDELIEEKKLNLLDSNKIVLGYVDGKINKDIEFIGIITLNTKLDGYIKEIDQITKQVKKEWYVHSSNINGALNNDIVKFNPMDKYTNNHIQNAVVKDVVERNKDQFVCTFIQKDKSNYEIKIDNSKNYFKIILKDTKNLVDGHKVLVKIDKFVDEKTAYGHVETIIGHINDIDSDILSIIFENGINPYFDSKVEEEAAKNKINNEKEKVRIDITDRDYITIDPASSKDLDDSIYVKKINDRNFFLSVSIADVSTYVDINTKLDDVAYNRATSIYLADRVIPMLPHIISNDFCSLNPNEIKKTLTVDMNINDKGEIFNINLYPSLIISKNRFSYDEVNDYYKNNIKNNNIKSDIYKQLDSCLELHKILRKKSINNGYIDFGIKEPIIILDQNNKVKEIKIKKTGIAQKMIEDFMVSANHAVTVKADELKLPFIYRTHNQPSLEKLKKLEIEAKKINFIIDNKEFNNLKSITIANWINNNKNVDAQELINKLVLRSMEKATYEIYNKGHFGLALNQYTHFTSPIRRYADLIVHRIFWMFLFTPQLYSNEDKNKIEHDLEQICEQCTDLEIRAIKTEREVNLIKFAEYMENKIGNVYEGIISTITNFGIFVEIIENTIEGLVRLKNIGGDFYKYIEENNTIVGLKTNKVFSFGQKIKIRVISVDKINKQIDFEIVGFENNLNSNFNNKKIRAKNNNIKFNKIYKINKFQ